ncbi:hypothetical protein Zm00014a_042097 [Zea mays]|uniref:Uncharacterized protein n=1 Tax=Zea mays TaxID=4577 RepID=A0A3L6DV72_MAIZE|nr:hypothetical protein Zm00014a_042097 [Zea mays]
MNRQGDDASREKERGARYGGLKEGDPGWGWTPAGERTSTWEELGRAGALAGEKEKVRASGTERRQLARVEKLPGRSSGRARHGRRSRRAQGGAEPNQGLGHGTGGASRESRRDGCAGKKTARAG